MAKISQTKTLFFTTSPRSPLKMIPEIEVLTNNFSDKSWNQETQEKFMMELIKNSNFENLSIPKDPAFSARDRINRAPKALGFVDLNPVVKLTEAGKSFIESEFKEETLLRQLLKFQLPSPYHTLDKESSELFFIKPYLEIIRLINYFGSLTFDEIMLFGLQMKRFDEFEDITSKIEKFRIDKLNNKGKYRIFLKEELNKIIRKLYIKEISEDNFKTRESKDVNIDKFVKTKSNNMHDYTDACFRYLRETGLFSISQLGHSISIIPEKRNDIKFILENVSREPVFIYNVQKYKEYLFDVSLPKLYSDNKDNLIIQLSEFISDINQIQDLSILELKTILKHKILERKNQIISEKVSNIKNFDKYNDIITMYDNIKNRNVYDPSLMLEWNTWRAMNMLDGGKIDANLEFDDFGEPKSTALGKKADIVCDYGDFGVTVEVTMQSGQRQYETEGEPVIRHLAEYKKSINKDSYCLFIAPKINPSCIAYFYSLYKINISYYNGYSYVIPLELDVFIKLVNDAFRATYQPNPQNVESLFKKSIEIAQNSNNEIEWYKEIKENALHWLEI